MARKKIKITNGMGNKIAKVMGEFKNGALKSSSGQAVNDPRQAKAIAISEAERLKKRKSKKG
jgi:hypothetical protein